MSSLLWGAEYTVKGDVGCGDEEFRHDVMNGSIWTKLCQDIKKFSVTESNRSQVREQHQRVATRRCEKGTPPYGRLPHMLRGFCPLLVLIAHLLDAAIPFFGLWRPFLQ